MEKFPFMPWCLCAFVPLCLYSDLDTYVEINRIDRHLDDIPSYSRISLLTSTQSRHLSNNTDQYS